MKSKSGLTARTADRFDLYQKGVQSAEYYAHFLSRRFQSLAGRPLRTLREDFCGTAAICCEFVKLHPLNRAIGVDMDPIPLKWCKTHNFPGLSVEESQRIRLIRKNVLIANAAADLIVSLNFSHFVFKSRKELLAYLKNARLALNKDGVLLIDAFGGGDPEIASGEHREEDGFDYEWEVSRFDPITRNIVCKIHFEFRDHTKLRNAFVYDWRLWTLPELQELFVEAGFRNIHVLWRQSGDSVFKRASTGRADAVWIACVVGQR